MNAPADTAAPAVWWSPSLDSEAGYGLISRFGGHWWQELQHGWAERRDLPADAVRLVPVRDEMEEHFIDANERMGEALVEIGMALGLGRPGVGHTWGSPEILAKIAERDELAELARTAAEADPSLADEFEQISRPAAVPGSMAAAFWARYDNLLAEVARLRAGAVPDIGQDRNAWAQESREIVQSGRCICTEDEACWEHEALEMCAEHAQQQAPAAPSSGDTDADKRTIMSDRAPADKAGAPAVPHKAAALLLAAARVDPKLRAAAEQVQDALIAMERELERRRAGAVPDTGQPAATALVRLGCVDHGHHDVAPYDAARIVASLTAEVEEIKAHPEDHAGESEPCPLHDALEWAVDVEMYAEHVDSRLLVSGAYVEDPETGEVSPAAASPSGDTGEAQA
ncbi:hypothetical protein ACL02T_33070 [Pseudonocardia sp. RS010]|uniref:hypothetical protein n=1 Tax=Pseudonocardia sp. RS010 TaxID=3385979 RepID=UPI0039A0404A